MMVRVPHPHFIFRSHQFVEGLHVLYTPLWVSMYLIYTYKYHNFIEHVFIINTISCRGSIL